MLDGSGDLGGIMISFLYIVAGLIGLVVGGDLLVRGAVDLARRMGVSALVIGITLVGFGTSTPELVTSLQAAYLGSPGIAIGNVVGSNIANILLILGIAAAIAPVLVSRKSFVRDGSVLLASTLACLAIVLHGRLDPLFGTLLILALITYVVMAIWQERAVPVADDDMTAEPGEVPSGSAWKDSLLLVAGLGLTIFGARFLVIGAIDAATLLGVTETVIGLTIVAVGTSLPELVTTLAAARRGQSDLAFGNIVGSNIFNVLFILGSTALIRPVEVPVMIARYDIWVLILATAALLASVILRGRVGRIEGAAMLLAYIAYTVWLGTGSRV